MWKMKIAMEAKTNIEIKLDWIGSVTAGLSVGGDLGENVSLIWLISLFWAEREVRMYRTIRKSKIRIKISSCLWDLKWAANLL